MIGNCKALIKKSFIKSLISINSVKRIKTSIYNEIFKNSFNTAQALKFIQECRETKLNIVALKLVLQKSIFPLDDRKNIKDEQPTIYEENIFWCEGLSLKYYYMLNKSNLLEINS